MVAVLPEPPLLVPELATGVSPETAVLRAAFGKAAVRPAGAARRWIAVGGAAGGRRTVGPDVRGSSSPLIRTGSADRRALLAASHATGRAPGQVLAGATREGAWRAELLHSSSPFGVAYHVAVWTPDART